MKIEVKCKICGGSKFLNQYEIDKNKTDNFYCGRECMKVGHSKNFSGKNNPFYGKIHSEENRKKIGVGRLYYKKERKSFICKFCKIEFQPERNDKIRMFCSFKCKQDYNKSTRQFLNCSWCGEKVIRIASFDKPHVFCSKECFYTWLTEVWEEPSGENAFWFGKRKEETPNWRGGLSFELFSIDFDNDLKERIRERDNYKCMICNKQQTTEKLSIHHCDYVKQNNSEYNLISLCRKCHTMTNGNREQWSLYFKLLIEKIYKTSNYKQEGATTISKESTTQANGVGSTEHPII